VHFAWSILSCPILKRPTIARWTWSPWAQANHLKSAARATPTSSWFIAARVKTNLWPMGKDKLPNLEILVGGNNLAENKDKALLNPYGVLAVNPDKHPGVNYDLAMKFVNWIVSVDTQKTIGGYGTDKFGQPLFYPSSAEYKKATAPTTGSAAPTITVN
jgi:hypothetical protein